MLLSPTDGQWNYTGRGKPRWLSAKCNVQDHVHDAARQRPLAIAAIGDSHMREMVVTLCRHTGGELQLLQSDQPDKAINAATCRVRERSWIINWRMLLGVPHKDQRMENISRWLPHIITRDLGRAPDLVLADALHWDIVRAFRTSFFNDTLGIDLREAFHEHLRTGRRFPESLVDRYADAWLENSTAFMRALQSAFRERAIPSFSPEPLFVWLCLPRSFSATALLRGVNAERGPLQCRACITQESYNQVIHDESPGRKANRSELKCCQMTCVAQVTQALNVRARVMARETRILVLDAERMLSAMEPRVYLWDTLHMLRRFSIELANLAINAVFASQRTTMRTTQGDLLQRIMAAAKESRIMAAAQDSRRLSVLAGRLLAPHS